MVINKNDVYKKYNVFYMIPYNDVKLMEKVQKRFNLKGVHYSEVYRNEIITFAPDFFSTQKLSHFFRFSFDVLNSFAIDKKSNKQTIEDYFFSQPKKIQNQIRDIFNEIKDRLKYVFSFYDIIVVEYFIFHNFFQYWFLFNSEKEAEKLIYNAPIIINVNHGQPLKHIDVYNKFKSLVTSINNPPVLSYFLKRHHSIVSTVYEKDIFLQSSVSLKDHIEFDIKAYHKNNIHKGCYLKYTDFILMMKMNKQQLNKEKEEIFLKIKKLKKLRIKGEKIHCFFTTWSPSRKNEDKSYEKVMNHNLNLVLDYNDDIKFLIISEHNNTFLEDKYKHFAQSNYLFNNKKLDINKEKPFSLKHNGKVITILFNVNNKNTQKFLSNEELYLIANEFYSEISGVFLDIKTFSLKKDISLVNANDDKNFSKLINVFQDKDFSLFLTKFWKNPNELLSTIILKVLKNEENNNKI